MESFTTISYEAACFGSSILTRTFLGFGLDSISLGACLTLVVPAPPWQWTCAIARRLGQTCDSFSVRLLSASTANWFAVGLFVYKSWQDAALSAPTIMFKTFAANRAHLLCIHDDRSILTNSSAVVGVWLHCRPHQHELGFIFVFDVAITKNKRGVTDDLVVLE